MSEQIDFWTSRVNDGKLKQILSECAKMRGCYPCLNRSVDQFGNFILSHMNDEDLEIWSLKFKEYCQDIYKN